MVLTKKRIHHYVWANYLRAWTVNERVSWLRDGEPIESIPKYAGQEKDFYKIKELTKEDVEFIKIFAIDRATSPYLQRLHTDLVQQFNFVHQLKRKVEILGAPKEIRDEVDALIHNLEEDLHCDIENTGFKYLEAILQKNISFYYNDDECIEFLYYLSVQYMRTKKVKLSVLNMIKSMNPSYEERFETVWNLLSHIFATNIARSIYVDRSQFKIILLQNKARKEFITSDQPVINTCAIGNSSTPPDEVEFYYPVSPKLAILITKRENHAGLDCLELSEEEVDSYNRLMAENSNDQLYATSLNLLHEYAAR